MSRNGQVESYSEFLKIVLLNPPPSSQQNIFILIITQEVAKKKLSFSEDSHIQ